VQKIKNAPRFSAFSNLLAGGEKSFKEITLRNMKGDVS
jgi:hypothetical protein